METRNEKTISVVSELAEFVNDSIIGYKKGAEETKNTHLRSFCYIHSAERSRFLDELNTILRRNGEDPERSGTVKGALYRRWMDVKAAFTGSDDEAIINSCLYGEEWALKAYHEALENSELPVDVRQTIELQRQSCKQAYNELQEMRVYEYQH